MSTNKKVLVAMSGGVDSSVTAMLLKKEGYDVTGVTFNLFHQENPQHIIDAKKAADTIGVPHIVMHLEEVFSEKIIDYFVKTYMQGKTPNPCALCNRYIKFASLESKADELGIELIATGHYSKLTDTPYGKRPTMSLDEKKSQEYFLALVPQRVLNRIIFPLDNLKKPRVREIAHENHLEFFGDKPDSQEVCFLANKNYTHFLEKKVDTSVFNEGSIITKDDQKVVGSHKGFFRYTVGQRRGIGLGIGKPQYVVSTNPKTNQVVIGDKKDVMKKTLKIDMINIFEPLESDKEYRVKIRYKSPSQECQIVSYDQKSGLLELESPELFFAPSNGQIAVLYLENLVVAAGEIIDSY